MIDWSPFDLAVVVTALLATVLLEIPFIRFARRRLLDVPSKRSSHSTATPRGGGIVVIGVYLALASATIARPLGESMWLALLGVLSVALVGWIDDLRSLSAPLRLAVHAVGGLLLVPLALDYPAPGMSIVAWLALIAFLTVTLINVVNFMDGIDALIASQLALFGVHLALLSPVTAAKTHALILIGVCSGFLVWNRPRAVVFLGDVGSGALGMIAVIAGLLSSGSGNSLVVVFLPLLGLFLDASVTLLRRLLRHERLMEAHRQHLYQRLANGSWGHGRVSLLFGFAATAGIAVAHAPAALLQAGVVSYVLALLGLGLLLDRTAPHPPATTGT